jgi:hypothetical protein
MSRKFLPTPKKFTSFREKYNSPRCIISYAKKTAPEEAKNEL